MRWYVVFFIIILSFASYGAYTENWIFSLLMLLCGLLYPLLHDHIPPEKRIEIFLQGFLFEGTIIRWDNCTGFWLVPTPFYTELHIEFFEGKQQKTVKIQTGDTDATAIRLQIARFIPELSDRGEWFIDSIIRICKL